MSEVAGAVGLAAKSRMRARRALNTVSLAATVLFTLVILHASLARAETVSLVKNIAVAAQDHASSPSEFYLKNGTVLFSACTQSMGCELWKSGGTGSSTALVKDIAPGTDNSHPHGFVELNGFAYFAADGGAAGIELWRTDGTKAGTKRVKEIAPGLASSDPRELTVMNGKLYFFANDGAFGWELWRSDGTEGGTVRVSDTEPGSTVSGLPHDLIAFNGNLYFGASDGVDAYLWRSNGTTAGTIKVKKVAPYDMTELAGVLYFAGKTVGDDGAELWRTDGTTIGTFLVKDINPGAYGSLNAGSRGQFAVVNGALVFIARVGSYLSGSTLSYGVWRSDGTSSGTYLIKDLSSLGYGVLMGPKVGDLTYLKVQNDMWITDGTASGTKLLKSGILQGSMANQGFNPTKVGTTTFFASNVDTYGKSSDLWKTDGSAGGTQKLKTIPGALRNAVGMGTKLFFAGTEPWISNGTPSGTVKVKEIEPNLGNSNPSGLFAGSDGKLWFSAEPGNLGREIWSSNGTASGTVMKFDPDPTLSDIGRYKPSVVAMTGDVAFIYAPTTAHARVPGYPGLWAYNRTSGTSEFLSGLYQDQGPSQDWSYFTDFVMASGLLYFFEWDPDGSYAFLTRTDGSLSGTQFLYQEIFVDVSNVQELGGSVYFIATGYTNTGNRVYGLWKASPTKDVAVLVKSLPASARNELDKSGGALYFSISSDSSGMNLWKSDGTAVGTAQVKNICSPASARWNANPWLVHPANNFTILNGVTYFSADDCVKGRELWRTNGTAAGTSLVKDVYTGSEGSNPERFIIAGGKLFFVATDNSHGRELWVSNGSSTGTKMVKDIYPGSGSSFAGTSVFRSCLSEYHCPPEVHTAMADLNGTLYFSANRGNDGNELWKTNGTAAGTVLVKNIEASTGGSSPADLVRVGNAIYFSAYTKQYGRELWKLVQ